MNQLTLNLDMLQSQHSTLENLLTKENTFCTIVHIDHKIGHFVLTLKRLYYIYTTPVLMLLAVVEIQ